MTNRKKYSLLTEFATICAGVASGGLAMACILPTTPLVVILAAIFGGAYTKLMIELDKE
jgi:hypothetical protein